MTKKFKEEKKIDTFIYRGFGFPVKLINVPMKKVFGKWCIDINMNKLMLVVLEALAHKSASLTVEELRFIRSYLNMTTIEFGKLFGVSHVAVLKWESGKNKVSPALEFYIRLYVLDYLKAKGDEFRALYKNISLEQLSKQPKKKIHILMINPKTEELKIAL